MSKDDLLELMNFVKSKAGKALIKRIESDINGLIETILANYDKLPHIELLSLIARLEAKKDNLNELLTAEYKYENYED